MTIKRGDKLKHRLNDVVYKALGTETNSGEVLVIAPNRKHPFYVYANMVHLVCNDCDQSAPALVKHSVSTMLGEYYQGPAICKACDKIRYQEEKSNDTISTR